MNVENLVRQRHQDPIDTWDDMKVKPREKYLPTTYCQCLIDRWQSLTQGDKSVSEYISEFDEYLLRCGVREESAMTVSHFRRRLRTSFQFELFRRNVMTLEAAYQVALEMEQFESEMEMTPHPRANSQRGFETRGPYTKTQGVLPPEPPRQDFKASRPQPPLPPTRPQWSVPPTGPRPQPPVTIPRPQLPTPMARLDDKGKRPMVSEHSGSRQQCYRCSGFGHFVGQCPSRSLVMEDTPAKDTPLGLVPVRYEVDQELA